MAARQHGVVSRPQLLELGFSDARIRAGVRRRALHRLHTGVYAVGYCSGAEETRWMAAVLAAGPNALLSHLDAAALWKVYIASGPRVHVLTRSNRRDAALVVHRVRRIHPEDVAVHRGIPVTSVARTLVDLTGVLGGDRILRALREAEFLRLLDHDRLVAAVDRGRGRRNLGLLIAALARHQPGQIVREELEHQFLELVDKCGVRRPETNVGVKTERRLYIVDCLWREEGVAVELDGRAAHTRVTAFEEDRERDARLSAAGLRPVRFTWQRVSTRGDEVIADLVAMLARPSGA
jgi:predicted transcriptional regulator of viral defense system